MFCLAFHFDSSYNFYIEAARLPTKTRPDEVCGLRPRRNETAPFENSGLHDTSIKQTVMRICSSVNTDIQLDI